MNESFAQASSQGGIIDEYEQRAHHIHVTICRSRSNRTIQTEGFSRSVACDSPRYLGTEAPPDNLGNNKFLFGLMHNIA